MTAVIVLNRDMEVVAVSRGCGNIVSELRVGDSIEKIPQALLNQILVLTLGANALEESSNSNGNNTPASEKSFAQQSRLESLGSIACGVAHDVNNIVTGVLGHVSFLRVILGNTGKHVESLKTIEDGARRAAQLSKQVLNFSKVEEEQPIQIDLRSVVSSTLALLRAALAPGCALTNSCPDVPCTVLAVEAQLSQIVMNLVVNARDAVGHNGQIEVVLSSIDDEEELARAFKGADRSTSSYVRILVADNGHGISDEVKMRMFEPYFTTKKALGTGLGLATVNQLVIQFGGAIVVDSKLGFGTNIAVYLPEIPLTSDAGAVDESRSIVIKNPQALVPKVIGGNERILVIDDEYSVRNVLCLSLEHLGYEVVTACGGVEALAMYRARAMPFDLVLLDMIMPDMSGERVFAALQEIDSDVAVMVVSGFAAGANIQAILDGGGLDYLPKPFTIEELARKVRACLD